MSTRAFPHCANRRSDGSDCGHELQTACPECGQPFRVFHNRPLTVDAIIETEKAGQPAVILIHRPAPDEVWALPGGFVDWEDVSLEAAVIREAREETGQDVEIVRQFHAYGRIDRDPRRTVAVAYIVRPKGGRLQPLAHQDTDEGLRGVAVFRREEIESLALGFDHAEMLRDYWAEK